MAKVSELEKLASRIRSAIELAVKVEEVELGKMLMEPLQKTLQKIDGHKAQRRKRRK